MKLAGKKPGMRGYFNDFNQFSLREDAAYEQAGFAYAFPEMIVEFIAVAVPF